MPMKDDPRERWRKVISQSELDFVARIMRRATVFHEELLNDFRSRMRDGAVIEEGPWSFVDDFYLTEAYDFERDGNDVQYFTKREERIDETQKNILNWLYHGMSYKDMAPMLDTSEAGAQSRMRPLRRWLGLRNQKELMAYVRSETSVWWMHVLRKKSRRLRRNHLTNPSAAST